MTLFFPLSDYEHDLSSFYDHDGFNYHRASYNMKLALALTGQAPDYEVIRMEMLVGRMDERDMSITYESIGKHLSFVLRHQRQGMAPDGSLSIPFMLENFKLAHKCADPHHLYVVIA